MKQGKTFSSFFFFAGQEQLCSRCSQISKGLAPLWRISVLSQLTSNSCYPSEESTSFPPNHLMYISEIWTISEMHRNKKKGQPKAFTETISNALRCFFQTRPRFAHPQTAEKTTTPGVGWSVRLRLQGKDKQRCAETEMAKSISYHLIILHFGL